MRPFLTPEQNLALDLIFALQRESRINRTMADYQAIAARTPKLVVLELEINQLLKRMASDGFAPYEICTFKSSKPGEDRVIYWHYKKFPTSISIETIRLAWVKSGMRDLQLQAQAA